MKRKLHIMLILLFLGFLYHPKGWTATCGSFDLSPDGNVGNTGTITCDQIGSPNIHYNGNDVEGQGGTLFSNVTQLDSLVDFVTGTPDGTFTIDSALWNSWDSIYIALKNSNDYAVFVVTKAILSGTWTAPPSLTGESLSHSLAFGKDPSQIPGIPIPAAIWLFGSALVGLLGLSRKRTTGI